MTSYFQDDGHDVRPPIAAAAFAGCPLACRTRVYNSGSIHYIRIVVGYKWMLNVCT